MKLKRKKKIRMKKLSGKNINSLKLKISETLLVYFSLSLLFIMPLHGAIAILNGLTHEFKVTPGQVYEGVIILKNTEEKPEKARIYQTDYSFNAQGQKFFLPPGSNLRSNAGWISFYPALIDLLPQATQEIKFKIIVPEDPSLKGTYWSLIMVEQAPALVSPTTSLAGKEPSLSLNQVVRYGIQIVTHIGETGERKIRIVNSRLIHQFGKYEFQLVVENIGERCLVPDLYLQLFNQQGAQIGQFAGGRWRLYPQTSALYQVDLGSLPESKYRALILLDNHDDHVFSAQVNLNLNSAEQTSSLARGKEKKKNEK